SSKTNPNALRSVQKNTIFTNVVKGADGSVWWEGLDDKEPPQPAWDWKGQPWTPESGEKGAHPNSRFTAPASQCPSVSPEWENPKGVPISAIVFGGRRAKVTPLVAQALSWQHGVFMGATMASEKTAAAFGDIGLVRRDPMAMLPFCGYNMADYFQHWLSMEQKLSNPPGIFMVNWFRIDDNGKFIWPGFGENLRVLQWIIDRVQGKGEGVETVAGLVPEANAISSEGLNLAPGTMESLLSLSKSAWEEEAKGIEEHFKTFGDNLPGVLREEFEAMKDRLSKL
ncbi:MAG: phosphoenolpyruvate carboxykinase (GTP), partial [Candidatus Omnitrophica bacterium]|nr:phosphoenolpyruvate carboxykinase (GTP) [Candidatus Omnitrophota bacterium]